jgi:hypothetical protein
VHFRRGHLHQLGDGWSMMNTMNTDKRHREPEMWTWVVVGFAFIAVTVMLYGPIIWELTHG